MDDSNTLISSKIITTPNDSEDASKVILTFNQQKEVQRIVEELIENLDPATLQDLLEGSDNDLNVLIGNIYNETQDIIYGLNGFVKETRFDYLDRLNAVYEETLRIENYPYFLCSVFDNFDINWHHLEWAFMGQQYDKLCIKAARDHGKCHSPNTRIRMFDGTIKKAKHIRVGDKLMGADSTPRIVRNVGTGIDDNMYRIKQYRGDSYEVNSKHTLTLLKKVYKYNEKRNTKGYDLKIVDIDIQEFLKISKYQRENTYYGFKVCVEFKKKTTPIEPYFIGLWLGDGNCDNQNVTNIDSEIIEYLKDFAIRSDVKYKSYADSFMNRLVVDKGENNPLLDKMRKLKIISNKHIPNRYLYNDKESRLNLLAGLIDSDGNLHDGCYYIGQINKKLAEQIQELAHSLGLHASFRRKEETIHWLKRENKKYISYEVCITGNLYTIPVKIERKKVHFVEKKNHKHLPVIDNYELTVKSPLKIDNIGRGEYVSITVDSDNRFLLGDNTVTHNSYMWSNTFPIWKMYRYRPASETSKIRKDLLLCEGGALITNEKSLAMDLMEIMKDTIESNHILRNKLYPDKGKNWGMEKLKTKNGAKMMAKSYGSKFRGRHPGWVIVDDFLDESALYSADQRNKFINYFHSVIMNAVVKGGQVIVVGTPFHENDLYGDLEKKKNWRVFIYPSLMPDGRLLWNKRYTLRDLLDKRDDQGNLIFSREHLCRPIVSDSSIFPYEILKKAFVGMENYTLVNSIENFPIKFDRVVVGCDFAMSSSVGADYSVFTTWGVDSQDCMWLLNFWREKGKSFGQQIGKLKSINSNFQPDVMYLESNQFQQIFVEVTNDAGLPVYPHNTGTNKHSLEKGLPSLALLFERGKIKFPRGDEFSKNVSDLICSELSSVAWTDNGLQGVGEHDDTAMSTWQGSLAAKHVTTGIGIGFM